MIRNELPHETYLELAGWYRSVGLNQDAAKVLETARHNRGAVLAAYLRQDTKLLARATATSPACVFP